MDGKPSGLPSSSGGKGKGVAIVGANPWYSDDGSDGSKSSSESERTVTDDFGIFVHLGHGDQEVDSRKGNSHEADSKTDSERTEGAGFGKIANSSHFSDVDYGLRPAEKRQKSARFQPERILNGDNSYGAKLVYSGHWRDADSEMCLWSSGKKQVKNNKDIPESWKVHPRKNEVVDGTLRSIFETIRRPRTSIYLVGYDHTWPICNMEPWECLVMTCGRIEVYYRHKDYNHKFRSKPEVQYFLDTGKVIVRKVPCILQKRSADASVPSRGRGRGRPCTTKTMTLNSGSGTSASGEKGPASHLQLPPGFV